MSAEFFGQSEARTHLETWLIVPSSYPAAISFPDGDKSIVETEALYAPWLFMKKTLSHLPELISQSRIDLSSEPVKR